VAPIDELVRRAATDPAFRARLVQDPKTALAGYELKAHDLQRLATELADGEDPVPHGAALRRLLTRPRTQ